MYRHSASTGGVAAGVTVVETGKPAAGARNRVTPGGNDGIGKEKETGGAGNGVLGDGAGGSGNGFVGNGTGGAGNGFEGNGTGTRRMPGGSGNGESVTGEAGNGDIEGAAITGVAVAAAGGRQERSVRYQPGLVRGLGSRRGIGAPPLEWQPVKTAVSGISRPRHVWAVGFAAGGGGASVYSGAGGGLSTLSLSNRTASNNSSTLNSSGNPALNNYLIGGATSGGVKQIKTNIQAGYSYWAGIYGEKQLSARWSVDIGLNLHYYSVRFETNELLAYAPSSASFFGASSYTYALNSPNAASGGGVQTYYNNYYFLEVPATVQWRINHNRSLPLFLRGGAVFSYLMSSNGLYYDNSTGNDEKDNGVVRRMQASIQSGLMVGLPVRGIQIQAGPEVQYALTSMLTVGSGGGHMAYGGLRVALMR